ncbi:hypothetical protein A9Q84_04615 [Halobacteriovorax marinus]|uniref:Uncharacterized protein n=1 Tax=Halobacteriovorax marinus TaxID=97084 RepID=A0A1Y5FAR4_9BACT|nr:hypothetical protein A9Q84_04615 [Halobacteriovorax marinus]
MESNQDSHSSRSLKKIKKEKTLNFSDLKTKIEEQTLVDTYRQKAPLEQISLEENILEEMALELEKHKENFLRAQVAIATTNQNIKNQDNLIQLINYQTKKSSKVLHFLTKKQLEGESNLINLQAARKVKVGNLNNIDQKINSLKLTLIKNGETIRCERKELDQLDQLIQEREKKITRLLKLVDDQILSREDDCHIPSIPTV